MVFFLDLGVKAAQKNDVALQIEVFMQQFFNRKKPKVFLKSRIFGVMDQAFKLKIWPKVAFQWPKRPRLMV